ncbi:MAG: M23 family metallopeptidase [Salibacteraceae bacterium]|nr:M23 family metallopeptidase [Salibacteraceae bacterium]
MAKKQDDKGEKKKLYERLRNHYKLVILNIDTFEERFSLLLTPMNVILIGGSSLVIIILLTFALLGWTPLRFYLPGYSEDYRVKRLAVEAYLKSDSMETALAQRDLFIDNMQRVLRGEIDTLIDADVIAELEFDPKKANYARSTEDSILRAEIEKEDLVNLSPNFNRDDKTNYLLFPPVKGTITDKFNPQREHFGIDVAAAKDAAIKAIDEGTVTLAAYTAETGYIIQIQHDNDLISVYKHNSSLLKKQGDKVRAGEAVAIIGETGEYSSGPHLHFEMWRNGVALNPEIFFSFE